MGRARVRVREVRGPLAPWAVGFGCWLASRGYASRSVYHRVCQLSLLSRWLEREGLRAEDLTDERAEWFLDARRAAGRVTWVSSRCLALPLEYLREVGVLPDGGAGARWRRISCGVYPVVVELEQVVDRCLEPPL